MSTTSVAELFSEKQALEQKITALIAEFECRYDHKVEIDSVNLERMRIIGPHKSICKLSMRIADDVYPN